MSKNYRLHTTLTGRQPTTPSARENVNKTPYSPARASEGQIRKVPITSSVPNLDQSGKAKKKASFSSVENLSKPTSVGGRQGNPHLLFAKSKGNTGSSLDQNLESPAKLSTPTKSHLTRNADVMASKLSTPEIYSTVRFETPRKSGIEQHHGPGVEKSNLIVAVRVRPISKQEENDGDQVVMVKGNEVNVVTDYGQTHTFTYDHCFSSCHPAHKQFGDQQKVYERLARPLLSNAFKGFNTCLFAYGQTGSGKSYSVMGTVGGEEVPHESAGIVPRFCHELFLKVEAMKRNTTDNPSIQIQISYFEIYKEKIQDLLCPGKSSTASSLRVREHPQTGPYVVDLSQHAVSSFQEVQRWLIMGNRQRATAATSANERSSRSHAIFTITLSQCFEETVDGRPHRVQVQSRINFIDLAGSERVASTNSVGERREEGLTINQSLLTLGRVITALSEQTFVPYRESVLTWLLKESLGGDSKTVMLATVSPCAGHVEETLATLRYACTARTIINTARISEDPNARLIRHLREQIRVLEEQVQKQKEAPSDAVESFVSGSHHCNEPEPSMTQREEELETELRKLKEQLAEITKRCDSSWHDKLTEAESKRALAEQALANYGLSDCKDPHQPCLVNVSQDPMLSGTLFFPIRSGKNWVGPAECSADPPTIQLTGMTIEEQHCCIENVRGVLTLTARAETYINGELVPSCGVRLYHGDRVIIGGTHYFHLHYPTGVHPDRKAAATSSKIPDFQTAHEELRHCQEERLQAAVREARERTRQQLLTEIEHVRHQAALEMSLQRQSYEDEIASLNRVLEERQDAAEASLLPEPLTTSSKAAILEEIELVLQDTQRRAALPPKDPKIASSFDLQRILNEGNAICRRLKSPYSFSMMDTLGDELEPAICVHDRSRRLVMHWPIETMRQKLEILREAAEESRHFPLEAMFDRGDVWQPEDESLALIAPTVRAKLDKIQKRAECGQNALDDSRLSLDTSSRRSSFLLRSPPFNSTSNTVDACKELISKFPTGDLPSTFLSMSLSLQDVLACPDRSPRFAVLLTGHAMSLLSVLPSLIQQTIHQREVPQEIRSSWLAAAKENSQKLQNSLEFVMQGITLESHGLFNEWVLRAQEAHLAMLSLLCELSAVFESSMDPRIDELSPSVVLLGFSSALKKVHQAVINLCDDVRIKLTQLPDDNSIDSVDGPSTVNNGWLVKACHDSITQVQILLEHLSGTLDGEACAVDLDLKAVHSKFHHRIDILLRMRTTVENLMSYLEHADLAQVKFSAAALEVQITAYTNTVEANERAFLGDLSFAVGMVHKIVAERRRMTALLRGRDITYSPLPARLLASSPSRKRHSSFDDDMDSTQESPFDSCHSDDESLDDISLSPSVIQRALRFAAPGKSNLKSADAQRYQNAKSVRFNVSDSPAPKPTSVP